MAQRKSAPAGKSGTSAAKATAKSTAKSGGGGSAKSAASARKAGSPGGARSASSAGGPPTSRPPSKATAGRPPNRKPGKSIVNQKQTPWGLIAATTAVVLFAAAIIVVVIATRKDDSGGSTASGNSSGGKADHSTNGGQAIKSNDPYRQAALPAAMAINGVTYRVEGQHTHENGTISYDSSPPIGGDHNQYWANCTGTVYDHQIANENAVHMLEHGAIWITYNPKQISGSKLATLKKYVSGQDRLALSPYAGLKTPISLQAWGYQLFLSNPSDPRIAQFIKTLKYNQKTTPEYSASCSDPYFKADESRPGHPFEG